MAAITGNILHIYGNIFRAFRYASFQVASVITTTGFCTADYDRWPELSKMILMSLMFVGACACLLYTSDAADEEDSGDLGGRSNIKKKKSKRDGLLYSGIHETR